MENWENFVNRTFRGDNLQENNRMMEQQLVESREKDNILHRKNQVSRNQERKIPFPM
jgi:hypothetical protein